MPVSSREGIFSNPVDRQILAELQAISQKHVEPLEVDHSEAGTVKIFSAAPQAHRVPMGGLGEFVIPACDKGRIYSRPLEIWKNFPEGRSTEDISRMRLSLTDGWAVAEGIVGSGKFTTASSDMRQYGVFVCGGMVTLEHSDGHRETVLASEVRKTLKAITTQGGSAKVVNTRDVTPAAIQAARKHGDRRPQEEIEADILAANLPTEAEINEAHRRLNAKDLQLVDEANAYFQANQLVDIQREHRQAAERTGNEELPWVKPLLLKVKCNICQKPLDPGSAICLECGAVVDEARVIAARLPKYEHLWDPTHPRYKALRPETSTKLPDATGQNASTSGDKPEPKRGRTSK